MKEVININPYAVTSLPKFYSRSLVSAYILRVETEFSLWLIGALLASTPWVAFRIHIFRNLPVSTSYETIIKSLLVLIFFLLFTERLLGKKVADHIVTHYLINFLIYSVCFIFSFYLIRF